MAHTVGIILSAVMVFTAGLVAFLFGAMSLSLALFNEHGAASAPGASLAIPWAGVLIGLGGWGVATGLAIVKSKAWARISMLAFGALSSHLVNAQTGELGPMSVMSGCATYRHLNFIPTAR
jgi:hypothetical protein